MRILSYTARMGAEYNMDMYLAGHPAGQASPRYNFRMIQQGIFMVTAPQLSAFSGAFGTSFASNLTPDKETGLGEWTEEMFIGAMRTGHHQGVESNRKIFPPMPTKHYAQMNDEDLKAILGRTFGRLNRLETKLILPWITKGDRNSHRFKIWRHSL